jgi:hypothetical protein
MYPLQLATCNRKLCFLLQRNPVMANKAAVDQIYDQLVNLFGQPNQLFCMEFPGRVLDEGTYAYDATDTYSLLTKPATVLEEEFRLSDDLYDVGQIVGGPNGRKLSTQFQAALNQLVPAYIANSDYFKDKEKLRAWLEEPVGAPTEKPSDPHDPNPPSTSGTTRMQLFHDLNQQYLKAKQDWEQQKLDMLNKALAEPAGPQRNMALEAYAKTVQMQAPVAEAKMDALFADLVTRGYYHEVKTYLSMLDIATGAERVEQSKSAMRYSGLSSIDETETVYPVQMQPMDWFKSLATNFNPVDLLLDPGSLQDQLYTLQNQLEQMQAQYQVLQSDPTGDITKLKAQVATAQDNLDNAQTALTEQFVANIITAAKIYFAYKKGGQGSAEEFNKNSKNPPITDEQFNQLQDGYNKLATAQQQLTASSRALVSLEQQEAAAESTDTQQQLIMLKSQMTSTQAQINQIQAILDAGIKAQKFDANGNLVSSATSADDPKFTPLPSNAATMGNWMDVVLNFKKGDTASATSLSSSASQTSWNVDLFFGSASGSSSSSSSSFAQNFKASNYAFDIGFRATKVTIDRGGWFDPGVFASTSQMTSLAVADGNGKIPDDAKVSNYSGTYSTKSTQTDFQNWNKGVLPAFPVSFIVVKDVTIKIAFDSTDTGTASSFKQSASSASGGFLCFGVSHSESSSSSSKSMYSDTTSSNILIRIPQPQILGWFLEFVPQDNSKPYTAMPEGYLAGLDNKS